ncbi:MAG: serine hydrolase [Candidatus Azobacteroides sp.]|nr:serine hydrolase [Candidatus Azobacteroides sp.]
MGKKIAAYLIGLLICFYPEVKAQPTLYKNVNQTAMNQWVDSVFASMTLDEKIGQLFMVVADPRSTYYTRVINYIKEQKIGGILFSSGTLSDEAESINLYQSYSRIPLFISFDGEWGLAMRLDDTPRFPKNMMIGAIQDNEWVRLYGEEVGRECKELGVHINFAPVLDVNVNPNNPVIGVRSFGENPYLVAEKGKAYSKGLEAMNIISVAKHFPGHGDTSTDSHVALPRIESNRAHLDSVELYPFVQYIQAGFAGVMSGHLLIPALDSTSDLPASLSPVINNLLTNELGFGGLKVTDALVMKGAAGGTYSVCVSSLLAGNDILLSPEKPINEFAAVKKAVETGIISKNTIDEKCLKILQYKYIAGLDHYAPIETKGLKERINTNYTDWLIQKLNAEAITLLKNENALLPLRQLGERKIAVVSLGDNDSNDFLQTMALYDDFDFFSSATSVGQDALLNRLKNYDVVVCAIHSNKINDSPALQSLAEQKEVHLCFFVPPYQLSKYQQSILSAKSVTLGYENTPYAQKATAEVVMGGLPAKGKLPVTIGGLFRYNSGLTTQKVRLSYQHPMEVGVSERIADEIAAIAMEGIDNKAFPGCQVLIAKNGVVIYNQSFGYFDYAGTHPVQNADIYDLASVTKATATVSAIMKLYDTGQISLQDRLSKYIPELKYTDKEDITIKDALFHQTGLPSFYPFYQLLIDSSSYEGSLYSNKRTAIYRTLYDKNVYMRNDFEFFPGMVSKTPQKGMQRQVAGHFYVRDDFDKTMIQTIAEVPLRSNNNYRYSDLNFILLKEMVENVSGQSFDRLLDQEFFAPLGASSTTFLPLKKFDKKKIAPTENDEFLRNQILIGYPHDEAAALMGGVSGNAGLFSDANDLAKLLQLFLNNGEYGGEQYISEATMRTFTQIKSPSSRRGLGFDKPDKENGNGSVCESAPASVYGHTGYTGTCFWIDPDNKLIYIFLSNRVYPSRTYTRLMDLNIRPRIQETIYQFTNN